MLMMNERRRRNRNSFYLSDIGYRKIWQAINNVFFKTRPTAALLEEYVDQQQVDPVQKDTIAKIIRRKKKCDLSKIQALFKAFNLELLEEDITSVQPDGLSLPNSITNRQALCKTKYQNLPLQDHLFVGRKTYLMDLMMYLSESYPQSIIQVDGIGGVGKTALVLEAAYLCLERRENCLSPESQLDYEVPYFGTIIWVSAKTHQLLPIGIGETLETQRTLQEVYRSIALTLEEPAILNETDGTHLEKLINILKISPHKNLLFIDNLETIENKRKVIDFIRRLHNTKIVVTTREQVGIYSNICLNSLSRDESLELIKQEIQKADISLTSTQQEELYQASSGLPLAIIYSIGRLANKKNIYSEMFESIIIDLRNADGDLAHFCFKKSVDSIINKLSYQLLIALSIFDQSSSSEALIYVAGLTAEPRHLIESGLDELQTISLVRYHHERYQMLPITREYALAQLSKSVDLKEKILDRWVEFYVDFGKTMYENQSKTERLINFYSRLDNEWNNFLGVLRFCKDRNYYEKVKALWSYLNNYANIRGLWKDRLDWLTWLIDQSQIRREHRETIQFMARKGRILLLMGSPKNLESAKTILLKAWKRCHDSNFEDINFEDRDYITNHLAGLYIRLEQYEEAHEWLNKEQKNLDDQTKISPSYLILYQTYIDRERSEIFYFQGNLKESKKNCKLCVDRSRTINHYRNEGYANRIIANIAIKEKDFETAEQLLRNGYNEVYLCQDKRRIAYYEYSWALLEKERGNLSEAKTWISQAVNNFKYLGMVLDLKKAQEIQKLLKD